MYKRIKVRIYPTVKQNIMIDNHFNAFRYFYNLCLEYKKTLWSDHKVSISGYDMAKEILQIRKETDKEIKAIKYKLKREI